MRGGLCTGGRGWGSVPIQPRGVPSARRLPQRLVSSRLAWRARRLAKQRPTGRFKGRAAAPRRPRPKASGEDHHRRTHGAAAENDPPPGATLRHEGRHQVAKRAQVAPNEEQLRHRRPKDCHLLGIGGREVRPPGPSSRLLDPIVHVGQRTPRHGPKATRCPNVFGGGAADLGPQAGGGSAEGAQAKQVLVQAEKLQIKFWDAEICNCKLN